METIQERMPMMASQRMKPLRGKLRNDPFAQSAFDNEKEEVKIDEPANVSQRAGVIDAG
jgi:hypothetical protein